MRRAAIMALALLAVPAPAIGQGATETEQRAVLLAYRQALNPQGDRLAAAAGILTQRAGASRAGDLGSIREQLLGRLSEYGGPPEPAPLAPGGPVFAELARLGVAPGPAPPMLPVWRLLEARGDLDALLTALLMRAAADGAGIWHGALQAAASDAQLAQALAPLVEALAGAAPDAPVSRWAQAPPEFPASALAPADAAAWDRLLRQALAAAIADPATVTADAGARWRARAWLQFRHRTPDADREALDRLRIALLARLPSFAEGNPLPFMTALVQGGLALAHRREVSEQTRRDLGALVEALRDLPMRHDAQWRNLDAGLPELFAETLYRLSKLAAGDGEESPLQALATLHARLTLLDDDWEAYLSQPFREPVQRALAECFGPTDPDTGDCRRRFRDWALEGAAIPEASGDAGGPFDAEYLQRETQLNPWQRINYLRGYWRELVGRDCAGPERVVNALEWSLGAHAYLALLESSPEAEREGAGADLDALIQAGVAAAAEMERHAACPSREDATPRRALAHYEAALDSLAEALPEAAGAFRQQVLVQGADVSLDEGAGQATDFVPEDLVLEPCEGAAACGVSQPLPASAALFHRFPEPYRVAHQAGLGSLSLCYADVNWVERRVQPRRVGGEVMADYRGRLGFRVRGRYTEAGEARDVFVLRFTGEREHTYLYAPNRPEVLADPCPRDFVGRQTTGELSDSRGWLVPRRLTFLSAERTAPSRLFAENWTRGQGWLEQLARNESVTVEREPRQPAEMRARLELHLAMLRERRRQALFEQLAPLPRGAGDGQSGSRLPRAVNELFAARQALDASLRLLLPRSAALDAGLRLSLYGADALVGRRAIREWRATGSDPLALPQVGRERLERDRATWEGASGHAELPEFITAALARLLAARETLVTAPDGEDASPPPQ